MAKKKNLTSPIPQSSDYEAPELELSSWWINGKRPVFNRILISAMLSDPRVKFGLYLLKGPILSNTRFYIECDNPTVKEFLKKQITRFWRTDAVSNALRSLDYGYAGSEIMYRYRDSLIHFDKLIHLHPNHVQPVLLKSNFVGMQVSNLRNRVERLFIESSPSVPKAFWTVQAKDKSRWYGQSRLYGAHLPYYEYSMEGGYRDQRSLWFYKNAYLAPVVRYPKGSITDPETGRTISNKDIAHEMIDRIRTGSGIAIPRSTDPNTDWEVEPATAIPVPEGLLEYGDALRDEIWEAMGIPPEIAKAEGTGAYAGRAVPQQAFYATLQEIVQTLISDYDEQCLRHLVQMNFGDVDYEIVCFGLVQPIVEEYNGGMPQPGLDPNQADPQAQGNPPTKQIAMGPIESIFLDPRTVPPSRFSFFPFAIAT